MVSSSVLPANADNDAVLAATDVALDKAINLYTVLEVSPDADEETIRRRINQMFLEAQSNFDHRNFRRRFYYQELFEVHLPQARYHLLDPERRETYNNTLHRNISPPSSNARHEYSNHQYSNHDALPSVREENPVNASADGLNLDALPSVAEAARVENAPSSIAQSRAPLRDGELAAKQLSQSQQEALSPADAASIARFKAAQEESGIHETDSTRATPQVTSPKHSLRPTSPPTAMKVSQTEALQLERRRDMKRRELIKYELMTVGTQWAAISALGTLAIGIALWFGIQHWFAPKNTGVAFLIDLGGVLACCFIAAAVGRAAHREARRRTIALLSQMPYEQLLRRCAQR